MQLENLYAKRMVVDADSSNYLYITGGFRAIVYYSGGASGNNSGLLFIGWTSSTSNYVDTVYKSSTFKQSIVAQHTSTYDRFKFTNTETYNINVFIIVPSHFENNCYI